MTIWYSRIHSTRVSLRAAGAARGRAGAAHGPTTGGKGAARRGIAERVEAQLEARQHAERAERVSRHGHALDIIEHRPAAQQLDAKLLELPVAPTLRSFVAEHGPTVVEALRQLARLHKRRRANRSGHACCVLWPQTQLRAAPVGLPRASSGGDLPGLEPIDEKERLERAQFIGRGAGVKPEGTRER